jgi:glycosyltransferase involved in cell wall biosynthesis
MVSILKSYVGESFFESQVKDKLEFIPNIVERDIRKNNESNRGDVFLTVLRLDKKTVKRKNLKKLLSVISIIGSQDLKLQIVGDGGYMYKVKRWIKKFDIENNILFAGDVPNSEIDGYYSSSKAFLLPSLSESFGLVYAEALLNGTPIMFSKNRLGFDGMFDGVGVGVDPLSAESIANGIISLQSNNKQYRDRIRELTSNNEFEIFSAEYVENKYNNILADLLK